MDGDPALEIVVPVNRSADNSGAVYAFNIDGSPCSGWPFFTGTINSPSEVSSSPAVADLDGDGDDLNHRFVRAGRRAHLRPERQRQRGPALAAECAVRDHRFRIPSPVVADVNGNGSSTSSSRTRTASSGYGTASETSCRFPMTYFLNPSSQSTQSTPSVGIWTAIRSSRSASATSRGR